MMNKIFFWMLAGAAIKATLFFAAYAYFDYNPVFAGLVFLYLLFQTSSLSNENKRMWESIWQKEKQIEDVRNDLHQTKYKMSDRIESMESRIYDYVERNYARTPKVKEWWDQRAFASPDPDNLSDQETESLPERLDDESDR